MPSPRGRRFFSFDGGGNRGISELYILQEMMERLKVQNKLDSVPRPCDLFDLMAGSNTGGIIALLLGRLRMSVEEAIIAFSSIAKEIFSDAKWVGGPQSKTIKLEEILKDIIRLKTGDSETKMMTGTGCRVFVCAMSAHNLSRAMPRLFRTYVSNTGVNESYDCTIWQAARATCAYPLFFEPVQIGPPGLKEPFVDGGLGCNNPLDILFEEAHSLFPDHRISSIISLGAGQLRPIPAHPKTFSNALLEIARDCEGTAEAAALRFRNIHNVYHRFTVSHGMESIEHCDSWDKTSTAKSHTTAYLELVDVSQRLSAAVKSIGSRDAGKISTRQLTHYEPSIFDIQSIRSSSVSSRASFLSLSSLPHLHTPSMTAAYLEQRHTRRNNFIRTIFTLPGVQELPPKEELLENHNAALSLMGQKQYTQSESLLRDTVTLSRLILGPHDETYLKVSHDLAECVFRQKRYAEAEGIFNDVLKARRRVLGHENTDVLTSGFGVACSIAGQGRYAEAVEIFDCVLAAQEAGQGGHHPHTLLTQYHRALSSLGPGKYLESGPYFWAVPKSRHNSLGPDEPEDVVSVQHHLASLLLKCGRGNEAVKLTKSAWMCMQRQFGDEHADTINSQLVAGLALLGQGQYTEAEELLRHAGRLQTNVLGEAHPSVLVTWHNLALALKGQHQYKEAAALLRKVMAMRRHILGGRHPDYLDSRHELDNLSTVLNNNVRHIVPDSLVGESLYYRQAEELHRELLTTRMIAYGMGHIYVLRAQSDLAYCLFRQTRYTEAEKLYTEVVTKGKSILGDVHPLFRAAQHFLASSILNQGRPGIAEHLYRDLLESQQKTLPGEEDLDMARTQHDLASSIFNQGRAKEAESWYRQAFLTKKRILGEGHPDTLKTHYNLARSLLSQSLYVEAEEMYRIVLAMRRRTLYEEHPDTLRTRHALACALHSQSRYTDAESEYRATFVARRSQLGNEHHDTLKTQYGLACSLYGLNQLEEAELQSRELLSVRARVLGLDHPDTLQVQSLLDRRQIEPHGPREEHVYANAPSRGELDDVRQYTLENAESTDAMQNTTRAMAEFSPRPVVEGAITVTITRITVIGSIDPFRSHMAIVRGVFTPTRPDELGCTLGQILKIVDVYPDDWALCRNGSGEEGMVPLMCLDGGQGKFKFSKVEGGADIGAVY